LSPGIIATSNLIYLDHAVVTWEHFIISTFMTLNNSDNRCHYKNLRAELVQKLKLVKAEFDSRPEVYQDVVTVTFDSKVRLVLSILKNILKNNNRLEESDITGITEYCVSSGVSAAMNLVSREAFDEFIKVAFITYPKEATVITFLK
jgi:hypothetical protein